MGTRSNIIVRGGEFKVYLYRHWDGYLAETGAHLLRAIKEAGLGGDLIRRNPDESAVQLTNHLLRSTSNHSDPSGQPRYHYEITTGIHGDIEHFYVVHFTNSGRLVFKHVAIDYGDTRQEPALNYAAREYAPSEFAALVNAKIAQINARVSRSTGGADQGLPLVAY